MNAKLEWDELGALPAKARQRLTCRWVLAAAGCAARLVRANGFADAAARLEALPTASDLATAEERFVAVANVSAALHGESREGPAFAGMLAALRALFGAVQEGRRIGGRGREAKADGESMQWVSGYGANVAAIVKQVDQGRPLDEKAEDEEVLAAHARDVEEAAG